MTGTIAEAFDAHRAFLFGLCYRMTGCAADAEDLVQDTFRRAIERPPSDLDAPLRPWLTKVATNLAIDALRQRKSRGYFGPWLPGPIEVERISDGIEASPEARVGVVESATMAFLCALETLEPRARAALVLFDVIGMTSAETAAILETTEGNVRVMLHRARRTLDEAPRPRMDRETKARTADVLRQLAFAIAARDVDSVVRLVATDVEMITDANREYTAAVRVLRGRDDVARFYRNIQVEVAVPDRVWEVELNGLPALVVRFPPGDPKHAREYALLPELDDEGRVRVMRSVLARRKLHGIRQLSA
ncbi:MAG: sigma-70 family RNA polymerase sigma factor [Sandaracinaceae bacterium]